MGLRHNQQGFFGLIILVLVIIAAVVLYNLVRNKAQEHGIDLPTPDGV